LFFDDLILRAFAAVLVREKGWRRIALRLMIQKKIPAMFSQEQSGPGVRVNVIGHPPAG
jgi:hypothetical protein